MPSIQGWVSRKYDSCTSDIGGILTEILDGKFDSKLLSSIHDHHVRLQKQHRKRKAFRFLEALLEKRKSGGRPLFDFNIETIAKQDYSKVAIPTEHVPLLYQATAEQIMKGSSLLGAEKIREGFIEECPPNEFTLLTQACKDRSTLNLRAHLSAWPYKNLQPDKYDFFIAGKPPFRLHLYGPMGEGLELRIEPDERVKWIRGKGCEEAAPALREVLERFYGARAPLVYFDCRAARRTLPPISPT